MKSERIILSFIAVLIGLVVAGVAFYLYQMTKTVEEPSKKQSSDTSIGNPTPTPDKSLFLTVNSPTEEEVVTKKTISISGNTTPDAIIIVRTETSDDVVSPSKTGTFSVTQTLTDGTNLIQITAIFPNGEEKKIERTVTYTAEEF